MQLVILSDLHLMPAGQTLYALDPRERFRKALQTITRLHADADLLVINGDLAEKGSQEVYAILKSELTAWKGQVLLLLGNHDFRQPFLQVFPDQRDARSGFVQGMYRYPSATLIALDTLDEAVTNGSGLLCSQRLEFLRDMLNEADKSLPILLFQHHPPFPTGLESMDRIALRNGDELLQVFESVRRPDYMFFGHVHRPISGMWRGIPFHIQRGLNHQVGFDLKAPILVPGSHEAPDYALVKVVDGSIVIHQNSFLYDGPQFLLDDRHARTATRL